MFYVCIAHCMRKSTKCQNVTILVSSCGALYMHFGGCFGEFADEATII